MNKLGPKFWLLSLAVAILGTIGLLAYRELRPAVDRSARVWEWLRRPGKHPDWAVQGGQRCGSAPFILPTDGFVGYVWGDIFRLGHRHQGLDIFGGGEVNVTPVIAAFSGYLSRRPDWKSSLIIRIPSDPLQPERQIWTYYTHMADPEGLSLIAERFPPGVEEVFVSAGTLLGYQGNYSGNPDNPVGVHLHFSIVKDDGHGSYLNELKINNTLDPFPYLGLSDAGGIPRCAAQP